MQRVQRSWSYADLWLKTACKRNNCTRRTAKQQPVELYKSTHERTYVHIFMLEASFYKTSVFFFKYLASHSLACLSLKFVSNCVHFVGFYACEVSSRGKKRGKEVLTSVTVCK